MNLGFRISDKTYFHKFDLSFVQISVWHRSEEDIERIKDLANEVKKRNKRFVIHPFSLYLSETRREKREYYLKTLKKYAEIADLGLIIHDETVPGIGRLQGGWSDAYQEALAEIKKICPVSIENGNDCPSVLSFWKTYASSIVFDIGHFEVAEMDCYQVIKEMEEEKLIGKLDYIHLHRKNGMRENMGICDHWPLVEKCPEIAILKRLLKLKPDVKVILEVDGEEDLRSSLEVLEKEI